MAKGVAVSQIILLVLGILVLAVVAYLLYTNFVTTGSTISAETCRADATRQCTGCTIASGGQVATCGFELVNPITGNPTNLATCQSQGNLFTSGANVIDCTRYVGGLGSGGVQSQNQIPAGLSSGDSFACPTTLDTNGNCNCPSGSSQTLGATDICQVT